MALNALVLNADAPSGMCMAIFGGVVAIILLGAIATSAQNAAAKPLIKELQAVLIRGFLVQACSRCQEQEMRLLGVSPSGRSMEYACRHCRKKMRALAANPASLVAVDIWTRLKKICPQAVVIFQTVASPLPYEQTTREPIPEAVRSEVWRRDRGRCVKCGSNQNLEFDHIIPVSRGGATTVRNLQLMCRQCNAAKSASI